MLNIIKIIYFFAETLGMLHVWLKNFLVFGFLSVCFVKINSAQIFMCYVKIAVCFLVSVVEITHVQKCKKYFKISWPDRKFFKLDIVLTKLLWINFIEIYVCNTDVQQNSLFRKWMYIAQIKYMQRYKNLFQYVAANEGKIFKISFHIVILHKT